MRITNRAMNNTLLSNLNRGLTRLDRLNSQLGSKKQINVPSDNPVKAGIILRTSSSIRETEQFLRNNGNAQAWLDSSDIVIKDVISVIHRAKELGISGASSHLDETSRKALADEVAQLHDNVLQLANSTHGGRFLFAGQYTQTKPFSTDPDHTGDGLPSVFFLSELKEADGSPKVDLEGNSLFQDQALSVDFEIGVGVTMGVNLESEKLFTPIFGALQGLHSDLSRPGPDSDSSALDDLDNALNRVLQQVSELGGKQNRVELAKERLMDLKLNLTKVLSEEQDLDYAEAIMELKMEEFAYRTALSVGARIIQPTLLDFLR